MDLARGNVVIISGESDFDGKPRPAIVIQSSYFKQHPSITILPLTSFIIENVPDIRVNISPTISNGLKAQSQAQIDKISTVKSNRISQLIGNMDSKTMKLINVKISQWLDL